MRRQIAVVLAMVILAGCSAEARFSRHLERGKKFLAQKDYARAILEFKNASAIQPKSAEVYYQSGLLYLETGNLISAGKAFHDAAELDPKHAGAQMRLAQLMVSTRNKDLEEEAQHKAEGVLAAAPNNIEALNALALSELSLGRPEDAVQHLEQALRAFPDNLKVASNLAAIKLGQRDLPGAEQILKQVAVQNPSSPKPLLALGRFYILARRMDEAEKQFQRAVELDPKYAEALWDLAQTQNLAGHLKEAERTLRTLSSLPLKEYKPMHALFLLEQGRQTEAVGELEQLARQDPTDRDARTRLVSAYGRAGRIAEAERLLTAAVKAAPRDAIALLQLASLHSARGNYADAEKEAGQVLHFMPDSAGAHYVMAAVYHARGAELTRKQELTEVLRLRPDMIAARVDLSQSFILANDAAAALKTMEETPQEQRQAIPVMVQRNWALAANQRWAELRRGIDLGLSMVKTPDLLLQDGILRMQEQDYTRARASLELGLQQSPGDVRLLEALAGTYAAQKQVAQALQVIRQHAESHPKLGQVQLLLGRSLLAQGSPQQAKAAFEAARQASPNSVEAELALAQIEVSENKLDAARGRLTALLSSRGDDARIHLVLGTIEDTQGHSGAAKAHYQRCLELEPQNFIALTNLSYLASAEGDERAMQYAQKAMEIAPGEPAVEDTLGWAYFRKGLYGRALKYFESAAAKPGSARVQYHLAMAYAKVGQRKEAFQALLAAHKANPNLPDEERLVQEALR